MITQIKGHRASGKTFVADAIGWQMQGNTIVLDEYYNNSAVIVFDDLRSTISRRVEINLYDIIRSYEHVIIVTNDELPVEVNYTIELKRNI